MAACRVRQSGGPAQATCALLLSLLGVTRDARAWAADADLAIVSLVGHLAAGGNRDPGHRLFRSEVDEPIGKAVRETADDGDEPAGGSEGYFAAAGARGADDGTGDAFGGILVLVEAHGFYVDAGGGGEERRVGRAGRDKEHVDAGAAEFHTQAGGETCECRLGGTVDGHAGDGLVADNGGNVDDLAGAAGEHFWKDGLNHGDGGEEIESDHLFDVIGGLVLDGSEAGPSRIVDQHVDAAEALLGLRERAGAVGGNGDVHDDGQRAVGADFCGELTKFVFAARSEDHARTGAGEFNGAGAADAAGCAGDEDHFVLQIVSRHGGALWLHGPKNKIVGTGGGIGLVVPFG